MSLLYARYVSLLDQSEVTFAPTPSEPLKIVAMGCFHTNADLPATLTEDAFNQAETNLPNDVYLALGDYEASQTHVVQSGFDEWHTQIIASGVDRNKIYGLSGNHDAGDGNMTLFRNNVDPLGLNPAQSGRTAAQLPYPPQGTWDAYYIEIGNAIICMLSDRNDLPPTAGRAGLSGNMGGYPSGALTTSQMRIAYKVITQFRDRIIIFCTHQGIKNTVIATGDNEGVDGSFHGASGIAIGSGRIESIYNDITTEQNDAIDDINLMLSRNNSECTLWLNIHTHTTVGQTYNGRSINHSQYGTTFRNIGSISESHTSSSQHSRFNYITIDGSNLKLQSYLNTDTSGNDVGFYAPEEVNTAIGKTWVRNTVVAVPNAPSSQPTDLTFPDVQTTNMTLTWSGSSPVIILMRSGSAVTDIPTDDTDYLPNYDSIGSSTVVYLGTGNSAVVKALTPGSTYHFALFSFNGSSGFIRFNTASPLTGSQVVGEAPPTLQTPGGDIVMN